MTIKALMTNLILVLLFLIYILFILFHVETPRGTGDQNAGILYYFYIFIAYAILSLILTIIITYRGGFNWISGSSLWRNIGVCVLWLAMVAGVFVCMYMKAEIRIGNKSTGIIRLPALMIYYGGVWLPLLMIVSYCSMLNSEWRIALAANIYKTLLLVSCAVGFVTVMANAPIKKLIAANSDEYYLTKALVEMDKATTLEEQFGIAIGTDERMRAVLLTKIKDKPNPEDELIGILMKNNQFIFPIVYEYIYINPIEHPERLIEALNLNLTQLNFQIEGVTNSPWKTGAEDFDHIKMQTVFKVLYKYFSTNREPFRKNVLLIKQTLETAKKRNGGNENAPEFIAILNKYKLEMQNWLDGH